MTSQVKLPEISSQSIYCGKYKDWTPQINPVSRITRVSQVGTV